jgi:ATP-dependent protease Clp ATPase subunit
MTICTYCERQQFTGTNKAQKVLQVSVFRHKYARFKEQVKRVTNMLEFVRGKISKYYNIRISGI